MAARRKQLKQSEGTKGSGVILLPANFNSDRKPQGLEYKGVIIINHRSRMEKKVHVLVSCDQAGDRGRATLFKCRRNNRGIG